MAESLADKLKRLAAEKKAKAAQAQAVASVQPAESESGTESEPSTGDTSNEPTTASSVTEVSSVCSEDTGAGETTSGTQAGSEDSNSGTELESSDHNVSGDVFVPAATDSKHPLAMQFAELEAALLAKDPEFKTILRQVHRHLGQDAELVTMMSEAEVQLVVTGMVVFANAEIVEPAKEKSAKAAVAKAKKAVITADDL